jgi:hypothetical protein
MKKRLKSACMLKNPENSNLENFYEFSLKFLNLQFKFQRKLLKIKKVFGMEKRFILKK